MNKKTSVVLILSGLIVSTSFSLAAAEKKRFKVQDFAGDWVMMTSSVGGLGKNPGPGVASTVLRHMTLDDKGQARDSDGIYTFYRPDGTLVRFDDDQGKDPFTLVLEDPVNGAGKLIYADTDTYKTTQIYDFIAMRNKSGLVSKLHLLLIDTKGNKVVVNGVAERQSR